MSGTLEDYMAMLAEGERLLKQAEALMNEAYEFARLIEPPKNLRPATEDDIVKGAVIWYPHTYDPGDETGSPAFNVVHKVLRPDDDWKAYVSDGCRYGLWKAFVAPTPTPGAESDG